MKLINYKNILATVFLSLTGSIQLIAEVKPPMPMGSGGFDDGVVVGGTIDNYLPLLFSLSLIFGMWVISRRKEVSTT